MHGQADVTRPGGRARNSAEKRALQACVALAAAVPVAAGLAGVVLGPAAVDLPGLGAAGDSHARYLSGVLLAIGIAFWSAVPVIERRGARLRLLCAIVVLGGIGRLVSLAVAGVPQAPALAALGLELAVAPLLVVWQARVAARARASSADSVPVDPAFAA
jgi:hypothetical protein